MPSTDLFTEALDNAKATYDTIVDFGKSRSVPVLALYQVAFLVAAIVLVGQALWAGAVTVIVAIGPPLAETILKLISDVRSQLQPALAGLMSAALSEMMGVEIDVGELPQGNSTVDITARMASIGGKVVNQLEKEFAPSGTISVATGETAAKAFVGFNVNFAVVNSFISIIGELVSDDHLEEWRELGVEIAHNLGLGRLSHRALSPLVDTTIVKPYTKALNAKYRQDQLTEVQYVHAFQNGDLTEAELRTQLSYKGYPDAYIDILITQLSGRLAPNELEELLLWNGTRNALPAPGDFNQGVSLGDIKPVTKEEAINAVTAQGFDAETATRRLAAAGLTSARAVAANYAAHVERLAVQGFIDTQSAASLLQGLPFSAEEIELRTRTIGLQLEYPRRTLTLTEMETAYVDGVITLSEWELWLQRQGYGPQDQQTLTFLLQIKADAAAHKKAGHPAVLTFAEITTAYEDGFIDLPAAQAWMQSKGFSAHDQTVLTQLLNSKKAAKKPATPATGASA